MLKNIPMLFENIPMLLKKIPMLFLQNPKEYPTLPKWRFSDWEWNEIERNSYLLRGK